MRLTNVALLVLAASALAEPSAPSKARRPAFSLDEADKRILVVKALSLRPGDPYAMVVEKLGKPTYDDVVHRKENDQRIGRTVKYYTVIWEAGLVNDSLDELVEIFLDEHDHVRNVYIKVMLGK